MTTGLFHKVALLEEQQRNAREDLKTVKALAEQEIINAAGGSLGKNADDRERALTIALASHDGYQTAMRDLREISQRLAVVTADLASYQETRRKHEWSVRQQLTIALRRLAPAADDTDQGIDDGADALADGAADGLAEQFVGNGMSGGSLESAWYAGKPRPKPTYSLLDEDMPF